MGESTTPFLIDLWILKGHVDSELSPISMCETATSTVVNPLAPAPRSGVACNLSHYACQHSVVGVPREPHPCRRRAGCLRVAVDALAP